ncbi:GDP-L-fucose synthase [Pandoraea sp. SD6-2]|uniref:GDP-L-fucose synthase family protein n=1 Tax=Pandoraea sp. SD6-2 TaxID=1286093 RepID=UPI00032DB892|nr:GDP-L-fucose synthase [Pandoraea sp. SD6-2]EON11774.1 NAD-dependent epimerase/dehydratase [Pandoraea sp. SD6-2]
MQRILLTGGSGMVGRNIVERAGAGRRVFLTPTSRELDLCDYAKVEAYMAEHRPDVVIHAAGLVGGIQANIAAPVDFLVKNLDMGRNVVMAAKAIGVPRLLNLGSSCMYPRNAANPLSEEMVLQGELEPTNEGYAIAKIVTARLCQYVRRENSRLDYKTLIPCNLYGRFDKFAPQNSHLIPAIIHKVHTAKVSEQDSVEIWGDGTARREFMYAGDLADAVLHALDDFEGLPEMTNIGLGHDFSINEYYEIAARVIGWQGKFEHDLSKPVGMKQKLVSIERQTTWGWQAKSSLEDGIAKTYDYYLKDYLG